MTSAHKTMWNAVFQDVERRYQLSFCHNEKPSILLPTFKSSRSFVKHWTTHSGKEEIILSHKNACSTLCVLCVCGEVSEQYLGTSPHPPFSLDVTLHKGSDMWPELCNQQGCSESLLSLLTNHWNVVLLQGALQTSRTVSKTHRSV